MLLSLSAGVLEEAYVPEFKFAYAAVLMGNGNAMLYVGEMLQGEKVADEDPVPKAFCWWTKASENGSPGDWPTWPWSSNADSARRPSGPFDRSGERQLPLPA